MSKVTLKDIERLEKFQYYPDVRNFTDLEANVNKDYDDLDSSVESYIKDPSPSPEQEAMTKEIVSLVKDLLVKNFGERNTEMVLEHLNLENNGHKTFKTIGEEYGISKQRVEQVCRKAKIYLRNSPELQRLLYD